MNKQQLIEAIASDTGLKKVEAKKVIESLVSNTKRALINKEQVRIIGLGSFRVEWRQERPGRNPQTGAPITLPAKNVVKFRKSNLLNIN